MLVQPSRIQLLTHIRPMAQRSPDLSVFTTSERDVIDKVLADLLPLSTAEVNDCSRDTMGWLLTQEGEEIPYGAALLERFEMTQDDHEWLSAVADEFMTRWS